jgi:transcriptional regulator with XRE-family HTH domain
MKIFYDGALDKTEFAKIVGLKLRSIRLENKRTIEATAFDAGMDYTQLSRIELGKINTSFFQIYKISKSLKVHMVDIVNELP